MGAAFGAYCAVAKTNQRFQASVQLEIAARLLPLASFASRPRRPRPRHGHGHGPSAERRAGQSTRGPPNFSLRSLRVVAIRDPRPLPRALTGARSSSGRPPVHPRDRRRRAGERDRAADSRAGRACERPIPNPPPALRAMRPVRFTACSARRLSRHTRYTFNACAGVPTRCRDETRGD